MVVPHLHIGDELFELEQDAFKDLIGEIASHLTTEFAGRVDYETAVDVIGQVAIDTVPLPELHN